ncbi:MAG: hypothetical protein JW904_12010 [Spirochaetales bacterium]|nr:hypothetical protein [Spirochaetales bacterium]
MKKSTILIFTVILISIFFSSCNNIDIAGESDAAASLAKADILFDKGQFQEALTLYEQVHETAMDSFIKTKAFIRMCESNAHLFRYGKAADLLLHTPLPEQPADKARVLFVKTGLLDIFSLQYSNILQAEKIQGENGSQNVFRLSKTQLKEKIIDTFDTLAGMKDILLSMKLEAQSYYFYVKNIDFAEFPTMYDFYVFNKTNFLTRGETVSANDIRFLLKDDFTAPSDPSPILQAADLMESVSRLHQKNHPAAGERWKIRRLALMFSLTWDKDAGRLHIDTRKSAIDIYLKWMETFTSDSAKAHAGYSAANMYNQAGLYVDARTLCEKITAMFPGTFAANNAAVLRQQIINPSLSVSVKNMTPKIQKTITVYSRNLKTVYFQAYRLPLEILGKIEKDPSLLEGLHYASQDNPLLKNIMGKKPDFSWQVETGDKGDHAYLNQLYAPPALSEGIYIVLACSNDSFTEGETLLSRVLLNVSSITFVATSGITTKANDAYFSMLDNNGPHKVSDSVIRYYVFDAHSGKPVPKTDIFSTWYANYENKQYKTLSTNTTGTAAFNAEVQLEYYTYNYFSIFPLVKKGLSYSYPNNQEYIGFSMPHPVEIFSQTDRPIYRPGDAVQIKLTALRRMPDGYKTLKGPQTIQFNISDPNGNQLFSKSLPLNDTGSTSTEFEIPRGRLLGQYSFNADYAYGIFTGNAGGSFMVEEYKRPEFEVTLKDPKVQFQFDKPAEISGTVSYYFGGAVQNAPVHYTVKKSTYIPWYFRSWMFDYNADSGEEIASGDTVTNDQGNYTVSFVPKKEHITLPGWLQTGMVPEIANYTVTIEARDEGGRTIQTTGAYKVGKQGFYFLIEPDKGFFIAGEKAGFSLKKLTVNDVPLEGTAGVSVYSLKKPVLKTWQDLGMPQYERGDMYESLPGIDFQLKDAENDKLVFQHTANFDPDGKSSISIPSLDFGAYRIIVTSKDSGGEPVIQQKTVIVAPGTDNALPLNCTSVTEVEKDTYAVGETAQLLIGSGHVAGTYVVELWAGKQFIKNMFIDNAKPIQQISVPVTKEMKGGFSVRWFGVHDTIVYHGTVNIAVPWSEKQLAIELSPFQKTLAPGEKTEWGIQVKNNNGIMQDAEVLMLMYDRSLEYYNTSGNIGFTSLYLPRPLPETASSSLREPWFYSVAVKQGALYDQLYNQRITTEPQPGIFALQTHVNYRYLDGDVRFSRKEDDFAQPSSPLGVTDMAAETTAADLKSGEFKGDEPPAYKDLSGGSNAQGDSIQARKAFADTAFFLPHVQTKNGAGSFSFTAPEQLTSWKIMAIALTADAAYGMIEEEAVTKKDLMVRLDLPRFFREKDKGTITVMVHNESEKRLTGSVIIDVREEGESIIKKINLFGPQKSFSIEPHTLTSIDWPLDVPAGMTSYTFRASATAGTLTDAEERAIPILPSRERLIESAFKVLKGSGTHTVAISMKEDPTRLSEQAVLQIDPQLTLNILNTIPFLIDYPYSCTEQTLNRYVPLAIVNALYNEFPEVKEQVSKIPKRDTVTPPWEEDDPQRLITLQETPWGWESKGRPTIFPVIDLLNPQIVKTYGETTFARLKSLQLSSGGFPWMPGGRANLYMTLYVLTGLAEAKKYNVTLPADMINQALAYINSEIPQNYKPDKYSVAIVSYAAYVVTRYAAKDYSNAGASHELVKKWLSFLEEHIYALTPFGKAYLAATYLELGNTVRGEEVLAMALDGSQVDPVAGVFWTPEEYSWVWYSDTVEKHAFFLKLLQQYKPDDERIDGMVQWLLFNRTGNVWKSTKASAAAIFALLDYLKAGGALFADESYSFDWGNEKQTLNVKGTDFVGEPFRLIETGSGITAESLSVPIEKKGKGTSFASLTYTYTTDQIPEASSPGLIEMTRIFYIRVKENNEYVLKPVKSGDTVKVGDQIEVQLKINTKSQFEYMHIKDPKPAGFEAETLTSGWKYQPLWFYEEPRDSTTNFFFDWLPHGEYVLKYRLRPTKPGEYRVGAAILQSMYAPQLTAHSAGFVITVEK